MSVPEPTSQTRSTPARLSATLPADPPSPVAPPPPQPRRRRTPPRRSPLPPASVDPPRAHVHPESPPLAASASSQYRSSFCAHPKWPTQQLPPHQNFNYLKMRRFPTGNPSAPI